MRPVRYFINVTFELQRTHPAGPPLKACPVQMWCFVKKSRIAGSFSTNEDFWQALRTRGVLPARG